MDASEYYELEADRRLRLVRMTLKGRWSMEVLDRFERDRAALLADVGEHMNEFVCLTDVRDYSVLTADVASKAEQGILCMAFRPRRLAYLAANSITSLQMKRIANHDTVRSFASEREAMDWLLSPACPGEQGMDKVAYARR